MLDEDRSLSRKRSDAVLGTTLQEAMSYGFTAARWHLQPLELISGSVTLEQGICIHGLFIALYCYVSSAQPTGAAGRANNTSFAFVSSYEQAHTLKVTSSVLPSRR